MYHFKVEKYKELLDGRSIEWLSNNIEYNRVTISNILNGKIHCKKVVAIAIVKTLDINKNVNDFFEYIEKGE